LLQWVGKDAQHCLYSSCCCIKDPQTDFNQQHRQHFMCAVAKRHRKQFVSHLKLIGGNDDPILQIINESDEEKV